MNNNLLWIILAFSSFFALWGAKALFGTVGLYIWIVLMLIAANIAVLMTVNIFGLTITLGNIFYGSIFTATDSLCELKGKQAAQKAVWVGFYAQVCFTIMIVAIQLFTPDENDFVYPHINALFSLLPRITCASLVAYLTSQLYDVWIFARIRALLPNRKRLWIRNSLSTISSQAIDSGIFCAIAFIGVFPSTVIGEIFLTTYLIKIAVAIIDTPFIYFITHSNHKANRYFKATPASI